MQKSENNIIKVGSNNPIIFTIILVLLFLISVAYMAFFDKKDIDKIFGGITSSKTEINIGEGSKINDSGLDKEQNCANLSSNIIQKDEDSNKEKSLLNESAYQPKLNWKYNLGNYRNYLLNVNLLVANFLQDKDYTSQINQIETIILPKEIKNILFDLANYYNNYLANNDQNMIKIFPANNCWIDKFIKIEKKSPNSKDREIMRSKIIMNLESFVNFFYSEKLQQEFVE